MSKKMDIYAKLIHDDVSRQILTFCKSPRSTGDIMEHIFGYYRNIKRYVNIYKEIEDVRGRVGGMLDSMEKAGAISFEKGKWKITSSAISILKKYFGLSI